MDKVGAVSSFNKYLETYKANADFYPKDPTHKAMKEAWNTAIQCAVEAIENADHSSDNSGHSANCNAMIAVEKLKEL